MAGRAAGAWLVAAAALFWLSWSLMPGVGITDAQRILGLVGQRRSQVGLSVALQLVSAVCYAPALVGIVARRSLGSDRQVRWASILLLAGAMGSAADAVFHLIAWAMTSSGLDQSGFVALMQIVQGPGLRFILPLIAAFFVGSVWLSTALARRGLVSRWNPGLHGLALGVAVVGGWLAPRVGIEPRTVGLAFLGGVGGAQAWVGIALARLRGEAADEMAGP